MHPGSVGTSATNTPALISNNLPTTSVATSVTPVVNDQIKAAANASNKMQIDSGIVFKVQIGAFKEEIPFDFRAGLIIIKDNRFTSDGLRKTGKVKSGFSFGKNK